MPKLFVCPYYRFDRGLLISCEGGHIKLPDRRAMQSFSDRYCCNLDGWGRCGIARTLTAYFERTEVRKDKK